MEEAGHVLFAGNLPVELAVPSRTAFFCPARRVLFAHQAVRIRVDPPFFIS